MEDNNKDKFDSFNDFCIQDLFKNKKLDIVAAALLLTGKLRVNSVELFRDSPDVAVNLIGAYQTPDNEKVDNMVDFMNQNGDMTFNDMIEAFNKVSKRRG